MIHAVQNIPIGFIPNDENKAIPYEKLVVTPVSIFMNILRAHYNAGQPDTPQVRLYISMTAHGIRDLNIRRGLADIHSHLLITMEIKKVKRAMYKESLGPIIHDRNIINTLPSIADEIESYL